MRFINNILLGILSVQIPLAVAQQVNIQRCEKNEDCSTNMFCGWGCASSFRKTGLTVYEEFHNYCSGFCVPLTGKLRQARKGPYSDVKNSKGKIVFKARSLLVGSVYMNWLTAKNWCLAHQKDLVDIGYNRLDCTKPKTDDEKMMFEDDCVLFIPPQKQEKFYSMHPSIPLQGLFPFLDDVVGKKNPSFWTNNWVQKKNWGTRAWQIDIAGMRMKASHARALPLVPTIDESLPLCE